MQITINHKILNELLNKSKILIKLILRIKINNLDKIISHIYHCELKH